MHFSKEWINFVWNKYAYVSTSPAVCCYACAGDINGKACVMYIWYGMIFI